MIKFLQNLPQVFTVAALFAVLSILPVYTPGIPAAAEENEKGTTSNEQDAANIKPIVDPSADALLKEMGNTLKSAGELSFNANITFDELLPSGQKIQFGGEASVTVKRPNLLHAVYNGDLHSRKIWYSGDEVTVLNTDDNFYGQLKVPATLDETMDYLMKDYGFTLPLADIVFSDPYGSLMKNVRAGVVVGNSSINGSECRHLAFVEKYIDWQLWVSGGVEKLPCKLVITYKTVPGSPQYTAVFSEWNLGPEGSESIFKPVIPKRAARIDFIKLANQEGG
ncbi:MAG: DUF2092 domain-containing protein [Deltaproteobacteria bacterium]